MPPTLPLLRAPAQRALCDDVLAVLGPDAERPVGLEFWCLELLRTLGF